MVSENSRSARRNSFLAIGRKSSRLVLFGLAALIVVFTASPKEPPNPNRPTGTHGLIMLDKLGGTIRFFDPVIDTEIFSFPVIKNPHDVAISPDHKTAYATIYGAGVYGKNPSPEHTIDIIDLATQKMVGAIDVSPYVAPHGIQVGPDGTLYVTCDISQKLLIIDPKTRTIEAAIDTEGTGHWSALLPDASKDYVALKNDKPYISVIDLRLRKVVAHVPTPNGTQGIVASPDGKHVLVVDFKDPVVLVISTETNTVVDRIFIQGDSKDLFKIYYNAKGDKIFTCTSGGQVNIVSASHLHGQQQIVQVGKSPMGFAFAADGKTALVANHGEGTISVIDLQTARVVNTFKAGTGVETLAYY